MSRRTSRISSRLDGTRCSDCGLGCHISITRSATRFSLISIVALCAFRPPRTMMSRGLRRSRRSQRCCRPWLISARFAALIRFSEPRYQGTIFHDTVRQRSRPTHSFSSKKTFAVSSGLSREMKPLFTALPPGASNKKRQRACTPPSSGSKYGICSFLKSGECSSNF